MSSRRGSTATRPTSVTSECIADRLSSAAHVLGAVMWTLPESTVAAYPRAVARATRRPTSSARSGVANNSGCRVALNASIDPSKTSAPRLMIDDVVANMLELIKEMRRHKHGLSRVREAAQQIADLADPGRIQTVHRFIQHEEFGIGEQRCRDANSLFHPKRIRLKPIGRALSHPYVLEHDINSPTIDARQRREHLEVSSARQHWIERRALDHRTDAMYVTHRVADRVAENRRRPGSRTDQAEQHS